MKGVVMAEKKLHAVDAQGLDTKEIKVSTAGLVLGAFGIGVALGALAVAKAGDKPLPTTRLHLGIPPIVSVVPVVE